MVALLSGGGRMACSVLADEEGGSRDSNLRWKVEGWVQIECIFDMHVWSWCILVP